jgi:hypothetical protein
MTSALRARATRRVAASEPARGFWTLRGERSESRIGSNPFAPVSQNTRTGQRRVCRCPCDDGVSGRDLNPGSRSPRSRAKRGEQERLAPVQIPSRPLTIVGQESADGGGFWRTCDLVSVWVSSCGVTNAPRPIRHEKTIC